MTFDAHLQRAYDKACEGVERILSRWYGGVAYLVSCAVLWARWGHPMASNWIGDVSGSVIVVAVLPGARRGMMAAQIKLDTLTADDALNRAEELCEPEIEALRDG